MKHNKEQFTRDLFELYLKYNLCISTCCQIEISTLDDCIEYDDDGEEVKGIEAYKIMLSK